VQPWRLRAANGGHPSPSTRTAGVPEGVLPQSLQRLEPGIELDGVEGVHGPRTLEVILCS
jgi:hypothetical protein